MTTTRDRTEPMLGDAWTITRRQFWHWVVT